MESTQDLSNNTTLTSTQQAQIMAAADILRAGGTVAFPTETVYGLGADITNASAISKIYRIKQRPVDHPLIVHISNLSQLAYWVQEIPDAAWTLARHFWPGALTLILPRSRHVPDNVTGGQDTVGIRVPAHPVALALLDTLGPHRALVAPSANRFGRISPTTAAHVQEELGSDVDMILDGGACDVGLESTIIRICNDSVTVLRPGGIPLSALESVLDQPVTLAHKAISAIRTSGALPSHYAPDTPLSLYPAEQIWQSALKLAHENYRILVLTWSDTNKIPPINPFIEHYSMPSDPIAYGRQLYAQLRQLDHSGFDHIFVEMPPDQPAWLAITDRLERASYNQFDKKHEHK
ncbi:MAG: L-threonylcarbamoyladenylate synthase [Pseudomonadota bacterium]